MNISDLRKIIHEEVVDAMREEFREILLEAVEAVETGKTEQSFLQEVSYQPQLPAEPEERSKTFSVTEMLQETARDMTGADIKNLYGDRRLMFTSDMVTKPTVPAVSAQGQDVNTEFPDFLSRAISKSKAVLDRSIKKDKEKYVV